MIKRLLNRLSLSRILSILVLSLLLPSTTWAEDTEPPITVAGIEPNSDGVFINGNGTQFSGVTYTDNTLSLSGANIDGNIISNTEALTINFQGTNTINGSLYINNQIEGTLSFTGSNDATLTLDNSGSGAVIYNFKSVDFGGYNLATTSSPGIFYIVDEPKGNPNQLWSNNIMGYASNVTLTKKTIYPLWIGTHTSDYYQTFTQVTEDNYTDILGNGKISFDQNHTLTLSGATISGSIISGLSSLNIVVDKANSIQTTGDSATCIRNIKPGATLTLQKKQNSETASLTVQGGWLIRDFKSISYSEGGLNLSAYYRTGQDSNPVDLLISDAYYADNDFRTSSDYGISYVKFSNGDPSFLVMIGNTTITTTPTTINASGNNDLLGEDGSVTLSVDDKGNYILTIDNASTNFTSTNRKDIVSTLPNLTIKYKGSCQIGKIISTYFNAPLTFGLAEGAGGNDFLCWSLGKSILPWEGFSTTPTFNDNLCFLPDDDSQYIQKLSAPKFSMDGSELYFSLSGNHLDQMHIFYSVDYVEGDDVESEEYNDNNPQTINKPCTVTAYTEFEDMFNIKRHSDTVTGKYFGFTEPMKIEFAGTQRDIRSSEFPKLLPETEGATYILRGRGNNSIIDEGYDEITDTGTPIVKGLGILEMEADFRFANDPDFTVLNEYTYIPVRVVPTKPTINYESEREYLNTDVIDITKNDQINGSEVYYSWTNGNDSTLYDSSNKGNLITGTLTAWTAAPYLDATGAQATILSDKTTQVFTTKNNISVLNYSEINSQTYTGSAIEPQITISSNGESQLTKDVDYTIAYSNNTNVASTESTSPPTITITGIGDYRGTKTINFNINQADFTNVTIGTIDPQTYTGNNLTPTIVVKLGENNVNASDYSISYTKNDVAVTEIIDAGTYCATLISTNKNFSTTSTKSTTFTINKATISPKVTFEGWIYGATANTPSVSGNTGNGEVTYAYKLQNEAESAFAAALPTNAGTYTIKASIAATTNYEAAVDSTHFTISKANIKPTVTLEGWTFGTTAKTPSISGNTGNGSVTYEYKLQNAEDSKYSTEVPTEAGDYTIKATIAATTNYEAAVDSTHFTIAKANIAPTVTLEGWTFGATAKTPSISGNTGNGNVTYEYKLQNAEDSKYSTEIPNEAGYYTIKATIAATANYEAAVDSTHFTISKANIAPTVTLEGWTFGATAKTPSISGNTGNGSVSYEYKLQNAEDSKYSTEIPNEAGYYTIKATIAATANYEAAVDSTHFTISKANINPTVTLVGWTFGAPANTPKVTGNTGNGAETFTYKAEGADAFTSEVPTAVGIHTVKVTIAETTNYNGGEATTTFTITNRTIDPAKDITFAEGQSYASFYSSSEDLELPEEGIAVFMITGLNGNTLTTQAVSYIPKGVPVLVMKASGTTQAIDPNEVSSNMLQYATSDVNADGTTYILYKGEYVRATGTIPAGKCYLKLNKPSGARALAIGNGTTGIDRLDNTVWATENWFDLNGRRIEKPTKNGLYIMNGKKVVVK